MASVTSKQAWSFCYSTTTKTAGKKNFTRQYRAKIQRAIPVEKHSHPYQIGKIDVPQHEL